MGGLTSILGVDTGDITTTPTCYASFHLGPLVMVGQLVTNLSLSKVNAENSTVMSLMENSPFWSSIVGMILRVLSFPFGTERCRQSHTASKYKLSPMLFLIFWLARHPLVSSGWMNKAQDPFATSRPSGHPRPFVNRLPVWTAANCTIGYQHWGQI